MNQVIDNLEDKLIQTASFAKIIMWLSLVSVFAIVLIPIVFILFIIYRSKLSNLKSNQSFGYIFNNLNDKTIKELKSVQKRGVSQEQDVAGLLIAHKYMVKVLIVVGIIILIVIGVIGVGNMLGFDMG